jgi:serine phosphatase RsbU (regulator of sigma subunit)
MKKKHLSHIIQWKLLMVVEGVFMILMIITMIFVFLFARNCTANLLSVKLESCNTNAFEGEEKNRKNAVSMWAERLDNIIEENGVDSIYSNEFTDYLKAIVRDNLTDSEINVIGPDGIIVASSVSENVGFDMHSGEKSVMILQGLEKCREGDGVYLQDFMPSPLNGSVLRFSGTALPKYGGFILSGQDQEEFNELKKWSLSMSIPFSRIGRGGYYLLVNKEGEIISSPKGEYDGKKLDFSVSLKKLAESKRLARGTVFGVDSYVAALADGDNIIVAVYPVGEAWEKWVISMAVLVVSYAIVFFIIFLLVHRMVMKHMVKGVYSLNGSLRKITEGDLEEKADFRDSLEFEELSDGINHMVGHLKDLIKDAEKRVNDELAMAAEIQTSFLPREFPPFPDRDEFELYACMIPAKEVGGDFYDFFLIDDDHLALVIADVSGKGIPAAMFMVMAKDKLRHSVSKYGTDVAEAVTKVNAELCRENDAGLFVTVWVGVLTISTGHMDYVDAGHDYPAIYRAGGEFVIEKDVHCAMVGAMSFTEFKAGAFDLKAGDILYLYTDGITEAINASEEMFREERMIEALNKDTTASVEDIDSAVRSAVSDFVKDAPQFDDMTTLVFRYKNPPATG